VEPQERRTPQNSAVQSTGRHRQAMRLIRDEHEEIVLIYELTGLTASDPRTLVMEWGGGRSTARLDHYPANWRELKDQALLDLRRQDS
jgi:hypothetical protein